MPEALLVVEEDQRRILRKKTNPNGRRTLQSAPKTYRWEREKNTIDEKMKAALKNKKTVISQRTEKLRLEYKTHRLDERQKVIKQIRETDYGQSA